MSDEQTPNDTTEVDPKFSELEAKYTKLQSLERYVETLGGADKLIELAGYGYNVKNDAQIQEFINNGRRVPTEPRKEDENPYLDPDVKALDTKLSSDLEGLRRENAELRVRLDRTEVSSVKTALSENIQTAIKDLSDDPEAFEKAKAEILESVTALEKAAESGNQNAIAQLRTLSEPAGAKTLEMMTMKIYKESVAKKLANNKPAVPSVLSKATDPKTVTRGNPPAAPAFKSGVKVTPAMTREALESATRALGKDPGSVWRN